MASGVCLVCGARISEWVSVYTNIVITSASHRPVTDCLREILGSVYLQSTAGQRSDVLCKQCFALIDEVDTLELRVAMLKEGLISKYRCAADVFGQTQLFEKLGLHSTPYHRAHEHYQSEYRDKSGSSSRNSNYEELVSKPNSDKPSEAEDKDESTVNTADMDDTYRNPPPHFLDTQVQTLQDSSVTPLREDHHSQAPVQDEQVQSLPQEIARQHNHCTDNIPPPMQVHNAQASSPNEHGYECKKEFDKRSDECDQKIHINPVTPMLIPARICPFCGQRYAEREDLRKHIETTHREAYPNTTEPIHRSAPRMFPGGSLSPLVASGSFNSTDPQRIEDHTLKLKERRARKKENRKLPVTECTVCGKILSSMSINRHWVLVHNLKPFTCTLCEATFIGKQQLKTHMFSHEQTDHENCIVYKDAQGTPFSKKRKLPVTQCQLCGNYVSHPAMKRHMKLIHELHL